MILERPYGKLHYEVYGQGKPVVMVQGVGMAGVGYMPQVNGLKHGHRIAIFDHRGIGQSSPYDSPFTIEELVSDVIALMDHLNWPKAHIVGHSMGGVIATQLAMDHRERVSSLVLMCTFLRGKDALKLDWRLLWLSLKARLGSASRRRLAFLDLLFSKSYLNTHHRMDLAQKMNQLAGRDLAMQPKIIRQQLQAMAKHDATQRLGDLLLLPALILGGTEDPIARLATMSALAQHLPQARVHLFEEMSHALPIERADDVNQLMMKFWQEVEKFPEVL